MARQHQEPENELKKTILEDTEALAEAIEKLESAAEAFNGSRMKRKAILILLSHYTKVPQSTIDAVLDGLANIKKAYLK